MTLVLIVALGVLAQYRLRGGSSPEEVATRYVSAVRNGDRVSFFLLSHPDRLLRPEFDGSIERYRGVSADRVAIRYEPNTVAAYLMTVAITIDGTLVDRLVLQHQGARWYIVGFLKG